MNSFLPLSLFDKVEHWAGIFARPLNKHWEILSHKKSLSLDKYNIEFLKVMELTDFQRNL